MYNIKVEGRRWNKCWVTHHQRDKANILHSILYPKDLPRGVMIVLVLQSSLKSASPHPAVWWKAIIGGTIASEYIIPCKKNHTSHHGVVRYENVRQIMSVALCLRTDQLVVNESIRRPTTIRCLSMCVCMHGQHCKMRVSLWRLTAMPNERKFTLYNMYDATIWSIIHMWCIRFVGRSVGLEIEYPDSRREDCVQTTWHLGASPMHSSFTQSRFKFGPWDGP